MITQTSICKYTGKTYQSRESRPLQADVCIVLPISRNTPPLYHRHRHQPNQVMLQLRSLRPIPYISKIHASRLVRHLNASLQNRPHFLHLKSTHTFLKLTFLIRGSLTFTLDMAEGVIPSFSCNKIENQSGMQRPTYLYSLANSTPYKPSTSKQTNNCEHLYRTQPGAMRSDQMVDENCEKRNYFEISVKVSHLQRSQ